MIYAKQIIPGEWHFRKIAPEEPGWYLVNYEPRSEESLEYDPQTDSVIVAQHKLTDEELALIKVDTIGELRAEIEVLKTRLAALESPKEP